MKILLLLIVAYFNLFAHSLGNRVSVPILEVHDDKVFVPAMDLKIGETGFILHYFNEEHYAIIARAFVVGLRNNQAEMVFKHFDTFEHNSFPHLALKPKIGDKIVLRNFYHRAFAITPNQETYIALTNQYNSVEWLHPDLFVTYLMGKSKSAPRVQDFQKICDIYAVGVIYIVLNHNVEARDCQSFGLLYKDSLQNNSDEQIHPFFSRFGNIKRSWIGFFTGDKKIEDYDIYYKNLMSK